MKKHFYSKNFFTAGRDDCLSSAEKIVPLVMELINPRSVVDVGCGQGVWLSVFQKHGVDDFLGVDGGWVDKNILLIPEIKFLVADLEKPLTAGRQFDLVVSLEVAEHLSPDSARTFVQSLTGLGPVILFSAAIPYQGGVHHVNEQWPEYWAGLFAAKGYLAVDCIRKRIWNDKDVNFWYAQNILIFIRQDYLEKNHLLQKELENNIFHSLSLVHPGMYLPAIKKYRLITGLIPAWVKSIFFKIEKIFK